MGPFNRYSVRFLISKNFAVWFKLSSSPSRDIPCASLHQVWGVWSWWVSCWKSVSGVLFRDHVVVAIKSFASSRWSRIFVQSTLCLFANTIENNLKPGVSCRRGEREREFRKRVFEVFEVVQALYITVFFQFWPPIFKIFQNIFS